ncbi:MAG: CD3324 family protein [Erysipelotrichaceae bacterium]|nr:CD3324 family protein [Erysipelotrichaceae bacterium]
MGYQRAEEILPQELIELIQQYVDGTSIYIPRKEEHVVGWGQNTDTKEVLERRNQEIYQNYLSGQKVPVLAAQYCLSEKSIWRIVRQMKVSA